MRCPPGGGRDELVWPDKGPGKAVEGETLGLEGRGGAGEQFFLWSPPLHLYFTGSLGCLPMAPAGPRPCFGFSLCLNTHHWAPHLSGRGPPALLTPSWDSVVLHSLCTFLAALSGALPLPAPASGAPLGLHTPHRQPVGFLIWEVGCCPFQRLCFWDVLAPPVVFSPSLPLFYGPGQARAYPSAL